MKFLLLYIFIFFHSFSFSSNMMEENSDSLIHFVFSNYEKALISKDTVLSTKCFISQEEFQEIMKYVKENQPNCIGQEEETFSNKMNENAFNSIVTSNLVIKQVFVNRIENNNSCGNLLVIPRVICTVQYNNNKVIEIPFLLIKTMSGKYKILRNYLNYKMFTL